MDRRMNVWLLVGLGLWIPLSGMCQKEERADRKPAVFSFAPNQLAANVWYRPDGAWINGHLDESFGCKDAWPELRRHLKRAGGSFSIFAAEIGYLRSDTGLLALLRRERIPVSVELPGFTQTLSGTELARFELYGDSIRGMNFFEQIFRIADSLPRCEPLGNGWFVTRDGQPFVPDEILFDERLPNLLPVIDPMVLATAPGGWQQRLEAARSPLPGYAPASGDYDQLLERLYTDYVDFLRVARSKWGKRMPAVTIHWCVNPGWEWRDQRGLTAIHAQYPDFFEQPENFYYPLIRDHAQYNSVYYLECLVDRLTREGFKPRTILMDVDWTYSTDYIEEALRRHQSSLRQRGIQMGINIVEASLRMDEALTCRDNTLCRMTRTDATPNQLYAETLLAITHYLQQHGIYEPGMQIRVGSWSSRPYEKNAEVDEQRDGSMAHTANSVYRLLWP